MMAPAPIDPRGPRFNQAVLSVGLLATFLFDVRAAVPGLGVCLALGAAFGPTYGPFLRFYAKVIRPRLGAPKELEDPRPPRFAATVGTGFLAAASRPTLSTAWLKRGPRGSIGAGVRRGAINGA